MCGIAALFAKYPSSSLVKDIVAMTSLVRHRGPDDEGYLFLSSNPSNKPDCIAGGNDTPQAVFSVDYPYAPKQHWNTWSSLSCIAALGHRRLSIQDLSPAGHQPMCIESQDTWITYNGEVYNFRELRETLETFGHNFKTNSDTEVILKAYQQWGVDSFHRFNGMFAFLICDRRTNTVLAVRDRFGVKPLYYWISPNGTVAFASEIKQFSVLPGWDPRVNGQRVFDFLNGGVVDHTSQSCFADVHQLLGGEYVQFSLNVNSPLEPKRWYHLTPPSFEGTFQQAGDCFRELFESAIRLRLRADVDVGSCLSGGLDSSSIVCVANNHLRAQGSLSKQKTFSACSEHKHYDERGFIDAVVNAMGVDAYFTYPSVDRLFEDCKEVIWHQDEPFGSTSIYAQWNVFKLVKEQGVKVMLDGQGADEHLAGYHGFFGNRLYELFRGFRWKRLLSELSSIGLMHKTLKPLPMLVSHLLPKGIRGSIRRVLGKGTPKPTWVNLELLQAFDHGLPLSGKNKSVRDQSHQQISQTSLPQLLHWEDRDSMAHSVESRTPFLDYRLVEFCVGLPAEFKIADGWTKRVLREGMKGVLPEQIRCRIDKLGFATAEEEWLCRDNPQAFREGLQRAIESSKGILLPSAANLVEQMISGKRPFSYFAWRLIIFGVWMERFGVRP